MLGLWSVTSPTFGDKATGLRAPKTRPETLLERQQAAPRQDPLYGPLVCRLCHEAGPTVAVAVRNIAETGFRAFPCCRDRDACRERREIQGKSWPLIDATRPSAWALAQEEQDA